MAMTNRDDPRTLPPKTHRAWKVDPADLPLSPTERREEIKKAVSDLIRSDGFELPPLPAIAREVFVATAKPNVAARDLARIVHRDAFIAGRVLKVANSAHYGFARPADTLQAALVRIGVDELRNVVVALGLKGDVFRAKGFEAEAQVAWRHSLATAIAAGMLAAASGRIERHRAFLAGLLHNVGYGVVLCAASKLAERMPREKDMIVRNVRHVAATIFRETGGLVARRWKLDDGLWEAIVYCDAPQAANIAPDLVRHVTLGRAASFELGLGPAAAEGQFTNHPLQAELRLATGFAERFLEALPDKFEAYESST